MTTPTPAKAAATKPAAKASPTKPAKKVAEGKIDHTSCYAAKLHPATPAGRSLCRTIRAEGKPLTKKSFTAAPAKPAPKAAAKPEPMPEAEPFGDDPVDEADLATG